jgi:hypothetical protein
MAFYFQVISISYNLSKAIGGLIKIAIYFSENLILFLFHHPHPLTPSRKGRGDFHSLNSFPQGGREFGHLLPLPLREGVGGWGWVDKNCHIFLFRLYNVFLMNQGMVNDTFYS